MYRFDCSKQAISQRYTAATPPLHPMRVQDIHQTLKFLTTLCADTQLHCTQVCMSLCTQAEEPFLLGQLCCTGQSAVSLLDSMLPALQRGYSLYQHREYYVQVFLSHLLLRCAEGPRRNQTSTTASTSSQPTRRGIRYCTQNIYVYMCRSRHNNCTAVNAKAGLPTASCGGSALHHLKFSHAT